LVGEVLVEICAVKEAFADAIARAAEHACTHLERAWCIVHAWCPAALGAAVRLARVDLLRGVLSFCAECIEAESENDDHRCGDGIHEEEDPYDRS